MSFSMYLIIGIAPITTSIYYYIVKSNNNNDFDWEIVDEFNTEKQLNNSFIELDNHISSNNNIIVNNKQNILVKNINY
jgi:hypothetical protein